MVTNAYHKVQDPEFQQSVKEKAQHAATATKDAAVSAYETAKDPEFQGKVKDNLKKGMESTKKFIKGDNTVVDTFQFTENVEASDPLLSRVDPHCYSPDGPLPEARDEQDDEEEIREDTRAERHKEAIDKAFSGDDIGKV